MISDKQRFSLESSKLVLWVSWLVNMQDKTFQKFLRRKLNCRLFEHDVGWRYRPWEEIHRSWCSVRHERISSLYCWAVNTPFLKMYRYMYRYSGLDHHSTSTKSDSFVHKCRLLRVPRSLQIVIHLFVKFYTKAGFACEKHVAPLIILPSEMFLYPSSAGSTVVRG